MGASKQRGDIYRRVRYNAATNQVEVSYGARERYNFGYSGLTRDRLEKDRHE